MKFINGAGSNVSDDDDGLFRRLNS